MLPLHILSKYNIRSLNGILFQWLHVTTRLSSSSSSSSSDSSDSDSDSDTEKAESKKIYVKNTGPAISDNRDKSPTSAKMPKDAEKTYSVNKVEQEAIETTEPVTDLTKYLNNMLNAKKLQTNINIAIQPKKKSDDISVTKQLSYEKKLRRAAEDVANTLGGDKAKTASDLLEKVLASRIKALKETNTESQRVAQFRKTSERKKQESSSDKKHLEEKSIIQTLVDEYKMQPKSPEREKQESFSNKRHLEKKSIIQTLVDKYKMQSKVQPIIENSISRQLLSNKAGELQNNIKHYARRQDIDIWNGKPNSIFENMCVTSPNIPELKTWAALKQRELKALTTYSPANIFQELILWTEQGKLWKFPIDNEQGMEEEQNVHFSEHIFLERHLKGWCPKLGPVRHFMELVCNGLSKNPYLSVQEKIDHIMWYKEYFKSKQDLLQELGAIQEPISDKVKEITEN